MFNSQKKKQKESKLKQLNKLWVEVLERSDNRKEELKSVFIMIARDFERWELGMIKRLDSGELVTSDILVFEEKLQVRDFVQGSKSFAEHILTVLRNFWYGAEGPSVLSIAYFV